MSEDKTSIRDFCLWHGSTAIWPIVKVEALCPLSPVSAMRLCPHARSHQAIHTPSNKVPYNRAFSKITRSYVPSMHARTRSDGRTAVCGRTDVWSLPLIRMSNHFKTVLTEMGWCGFIWHDFEKSVIEVPADRGDISWKDRNMFNFVLALLFPGLFMTWMVHKTSYWTAVAIFTQTIGQPCDNKRAFQTWQMTMLGSGGSIHSSSASRHTETKWCQEMNLTYIGICGNDDFSDLIGHQQFHFIFRYFIW